MYSLKKCKNIINIFILIIYSFNSKEIEQNNLINEFTGIYISTNDKNDISNKIFDLSSLNLSDIDYQLYINETLQTNSSNNFPFKKDILYNVRVIFNKLLKTTNTVYHIIYFQNI